ncbi:MAG: fused MFS/spermidine synthase [Candidatus Magasanikbacteria bacterium]|nr:fused MFS/spermidine synthase [Candidatus Magasanikbacteria bacterium]
MKKYLLEIIVFICGAVVMILELAGSRVMAPYLGTSLIVWSSLIGLILGALSFGYWWGGKIADKLPNWKTFSGIIFLAAIFIGLTAIFKEPILITLQEIIKNIRTNSIVSTCILFVPASLMLGMVSPYAVRLKIHDVQNSGKTVGNLYAISTLGSIFGTFLAGFYLLATFGTTKILYILAISLIVVSIASFSKAELKAKITTIVILICFGSFSSAIQIFAAQRGLVDTDSAYQRIQIFDGEYQDTNREARFLRTDNFSTQSGMFLDGDDLVFEYTKFFDLHKYLNPDAKNALMIGGAAYTYPRHFLQTTSGTKMTVAEIDPKITELAKKYFRLTDDPRIRIVHEDGRVFLNRNEEKFDLIFGDAFKSFSPPHQLTTKEAVEKMYNSLSDDGIALVNIISAIDGDKGEFLRAEYKTYKSVFPDVQLFTVRKTDSGFRVQNLIIVAMKKPRVDWNSDDAQMATLLSYRWIKPIGDDLPVLTDDFAPTDNYLLKLID